MLVKRKIMTKPFLLFPSFKLYFITRIYEYDIKVKLRVSESKENLFALQSVSKFVKSKLLFLLVAIIIENVKFHPYLGADYVKYMLKRSKNGFLSIFF